MVTKIFVEMVYECGGKKKINTALSVAGAQTIPTWENRCFIVTLHTSKASSKCGITTHSINPYFICIIHGRNDAGNFMWFENSNKISDKTINYSAGKWNGWKPINFVDESHE